MKQFSAVLVILALVVTGLVVWVWPQQSTINTPQEPQNKIDHEAGRAKLRQPSQTIKSLYITQDPVFEQEFLNIYEVTVVPDLVAAQAYTKPYHVLYVDRVSLEGIDHHWLRERYLEHIVIVGVDIQMSQLAEILEVSTPVDDVQRYEGYMIFSSAFADHNGSGTSSIWIAPPEEALVLGTQTYFQQIAP